MKAASRSVRRHAELERAFGQEAAVPNYSTQRVRRAADMVLGKNVSGEEASAILLALILDPCTLSSASDAFRRDRSVCGSPAENAFLPFSSANSSALCDARRQLCENAARSTPMRRTPGSDNPANFKPASKESSGSRGLSALPSRSRRGQTASPRRSLQAQRAQGNIIPIVKSGSANSANSRTGDPTYAATYVGHAFDRAAMRFSSHGGISLLFRKRRLQRPIRNGNPPLVHKTKGNHVTIDEQAHNPNPREAKSDDSASNPCSSKNGVDMNADQSSGKKPRKPNSQKRIRAFVWDASKRNVADNTRKIATWENPPAYPEERFKKLDSKFKSDIKSIDHLQILDRPSSEIVEPRISACGENKLTLWLPFNTPLDAYWAAESALGQYGINALKIDDRIGRVIITAKESTDYGYTPFIKRSFTPKDRRIKTIRPSETKHFLHYLQHASAKRTGDAAQDEFELKLMFTVSNCMDVQLKASEDLIVHAGNNGFLCRPLDEALEDLKELWEALRTVRHPFCPPTRWDVITMLRRKGHLLPVDKKHSALRPFLSSASFSDIARIVENTRLCSFDDIRSSSRASGTVRARYIAAHVMRSTTSRTVEQIGAALGNRDHSSIVHGLNQIDAWAKARPLNALLLDVFCRLADNVGICNALRTDPEMKERLASIPPLGKSGSKNG